MALFNPLRRLRELDENSPQFYEQLSNFLRGDEYQSVLSELRGNDLVWLIDYLDNVLIGIPDRASVLFRQSLYELKRICGVKQVLPSSCTLPEALLGCVYEGTFGGSRVRIRRVKMYPGGDPQKAKQIFHQVAAVSKHLTHPNIVPLLGVTTEPFELISKWMSGGELPEYIMRHPNADRLALLSDVAKGLNYLHSSNMVHGDLKGSSVLVDANGHARITDFGLASITQDPDFMRSASAEHGRNTRWVAPEILDGQGTYSKEADVFSFAGVAIEVFSGTAPFSDKTPREAASAIAGGERPPCPAHIGFTDRLWGLTSRCWNGEAHLRPNALEISCNLNGIPALKLLIDHPHGSEEHVSLITDIFSLRDVTEVVSHIRGDDAQPFVDVIDETLDSLEPWLRRKCLTALCKICCRQALLPRSAQIPLCYNRMGTPLYRGGYADVWEGEHEGSKVAVKVLTVYMTSDLDKITKRFCKEVIAWKALHHQNILPLLGVTMTNNQFVMVSEWMTNGNINQFIKTHEDTNRFELLQGVSQGLIYMHDEGMIHGDLKGANILINNQGHACLADFGLTAIVSDPAYQTTSHSSAAAGTIRWMSPERLDPTRFDVEDGRPTKESDCYALGMVMLEVLSGDVPFTRDCHELMVMNKVLEGMCPERPQGAAGVWFTDDLWGTLQTFWSPHPKDRPTAEAALECLKRFPTSLQTLLPISDVLLKLGIELQLIPFVLSAAWRAEQSSIGSPLMPTESRNLVEIFDRVVSSRTVNPILKNRCFKVLRNVSHTQEVLPKSCYLTDTTLSGPIPYASDEFADIWRAQLDERQVSIRAFQLQNVVGLEEAKRLFYREVIAWKYTSHPNVVPFLGVSEKLFPFCIVNPWLQNGNILRYIRKNENVNRLQLLAQAACGLEYLHSLGIVHGGVSPWNILIDDGGSACLGCFGITSLVANPVIAEQGCTTTPKSKVFRYMAPEALDPLQSQINNNVPAKEGDIYSFAMTAYEVLTGIRPYGSSHNDAIISRVLFSDRPSRPQAQNAKWLPDQIWNMITACWSEKQELRWDIHAVYTQLSESSVQEIAGDGQGDKHVSQAAEHAGEADHTSEFPVTPQSSVRSRSDTSSTPSERAIPDYPNPARPRRRRVLTARGSGRILGFGVRRIIRPLFTG